MASEGSFVLGHHQCGRTIKIQVRVHQPSSHRVQTRRWRRSRRSRGEFTQGVLQQRAQRNAALRG